MFIRLAFYTYLLLLSFVDILYQKIPNNILFGLFLTAYCSFIHTSYISITIRILEAAIIFCLFLFLLIIKIPFGIGDLKLFVIATFCMGFFRTVLALLIASLTGLLICLLKKIKYGKSGKLPFAPFVTFGYLISELTGVF